MARRIMAIDDDEDILQLLRDLLTDEGYDVATYTSPELAVMHLGDRRPDVVILDWLFGQEGRGMQLLQRFKLRPSTARLPIIVCTAAKPTVQEIEGALQARGVSVVYKPFMIEELLAAVQAAIQSTEPRAT